MKAILALEDGTLFVGQSVVPAHVLVRWYSIRE